jgi:hypothetical protein
MLALSFATALAVFETGAFFTDALATGFTTFAGAVTFFGVAEAFGAVFFAVAIFKFPFLFTWLRYFNQYRIVSNIFIRYPRRHSIVRKLLDKLPSLSN